MKVISTLLERQQELRAQLNAIYEEMRAIEVSLAAYKNISPAEMGRPVSIVQSGLFDKKTQKAPSKPTIKQMIVVVLDGVESGLNANAILDEINDRWDMKLVRTSLSPQLSRLKQEGHLIYFNNKWRLAEKNEASGVLPPEAREGLMPKSINPDSPKRPLAGSSPKENSDRKEGEP